MIVALAGNPNCGKTALFNALTGANQHVGNFPGVTVEKKSAVLRRFPDCTLVDLPGLYSLRTFTEEERVARHFLLKDRPDAILNVVDAVHPERNLYLTLQLLELELPMVIALNRMDEVRGNGGRADAYLLAQRLGVPVIAVSALRGDGVEVLAETLHQSAGRHRIIPPNTAAEPAASCIRRFAELLPQICVPLPPTFCASRLLERDRAVAEQVPLPPAVEQKLQTERRLLEHQTGLDAAAALACARYTWVDQLCHDAFTAPRERIEHRRTVRLDRLLTGKWTAYPILCMVLLLIFVLTFRTAGGGISRLLAMGMDLLQQAIRSLLTVCGVRPLLIGLIADGLLAGAGSILSFLPVILTLFFLLSLLEDTGYLARAAFLLDAPMRRMGLSGKCAVPLLLGFGCSVPAVMATRTLPAGQERRRTILLIPFMSCSAKLPVYALLVSVFFPNHTAWILLLLYLTGIVLAYGTAVYLQKTAPHTGSVPFLIELPDYRLPSMKSVVRRMLQRAGEFVRKAFSVILLASAAVWFLRSFTPALTLCTEQADSLLAYVSRLLTPVFAPIGCGDWRLIASLLAGLTAKEAVLSTLSVLFGGAAQLTNGLRGVFSPLSAMAFLVFTLLYSPCAAAISSIRRELNSRLSAVAVVLVQCAAAWFCAAAIVGIGALFGLT